MDIFLRVFSYCKRYPFFAVATLACAVTSTIMGLVYPSLAGHIIDAIGAGKAGDLLWMVGGLATAFFLRDAFNSLRLRLNNTFEQKVIFDLRHNLYSAIQKFPLPWFDQSSTGDLMTKVSEDVVNVERMLIDGIEQGVVALLQVLIVGFALFHLNAHLAWWALVPVPFLVAGALWYTLTAHKRYSIVRRATSDMNSLLLDNLQGVRQIKSYVREERELNHFAEKANSVRKATLIVMRAWAWYSPSMALFASLGVVPVLYFGGLEVIHGGSLRIGELVSFLLYVGMFYEPIGRLHQLNQLMQSGRAAGKRVFKLLDTELEYEPAAPKSLIPRKGAGREIEFKNVSFSYRDNIPVLHDISIHVKPGMTVALVGSTGAGKTSLVNLVPRFYRHSKGEITVDGVSVNEVAAEELRKEIGVVSQESFLFNDTIRNNLLFGRPEATDKELRAALEAANAWKFVDALPEKIDTHVGERGVKLSVGEKQRISIARALLKDPPILILDEATASVDTATELLIQQALDRLLSHRTSFVIAHRLSTVRNADLICVMEKGRIIERGTHEELMQLGGLYAKLCTVQNPYNTIEETLSHISQPA